MKSRGEDDCLGEMFQLKSLSFANDEGSERPIDP